MRLRALTGRTGRAVLLLAIGAGAGAAAAAIAAVPGSDGVIHACYEVQGNGTPTTGGANVRIIDPSAGQTCNPAGAPAAAEHALDWNVSGPPGPAGAAGSPGAPGATGPQGASGPAGTTVSIDGQTFTLGAGKTLTGPTSPVPPLQVSPGAAPVASMNLGGGAGNSGVLAWQLVNAPTAAARSSIKGIQIVKHVDKSSPTLFKACVNGKHFPKVVITVRKATADGGPQTIVLTNATVDSYTTDADKGKGGAGTVTESVSLSFSSINVEYN